MNSLRQFILDYYKQNGREATIRFIEEAGLEIGLYDSFFRTLDKDLQNGTNQKV